MSVDANHLVTLESDDLLVEVAPEVGGRITRLIAKRTGYDFLWRNPSVPLRREEPGTEYDPNFYGGIDELLPNDIPETIDGIACPDHGELWTTAQQSMRVSQREVWLSSTLPLTGLNYQRRFFVSANRCYVQARVQNRSEATRRFLWKLHAALAIEPGDRIDCPAKWFAAADPDWSRRQGVGPWDGETVPEFDGTTEFLYLSKLSEPTVSWRRGGKTFKILFDAKAFPFVWYFASYGGFDGHHVAILEPCTTMPISVNEAALSGQCSVLQPHHSLATSYIYEAVDAD